MEFEKKEENDKMKKSTRRRKYMHGCLSLKQEEKPAAAAAAGSNLELKMMSCTLSDDGYSCIIPTQTHLVVMINGIIGSAADWKFAAKQFLGRYPKDVLVHCCKRNYGMLTLDGVDVMGERLAEEVLSVIKQRPRLQKISFVAHSLGGLVARYAVGRLYRQNTMREQDKMNEDCTFDEGHLCEGDKLKGKIAGLEPMNFITFATPHIGVRGHKQAPLFCSLTILEKAARHTSWMLRRTGKHLLLTDNENGKPPLLLQMVNDSEDLHFLSALHSFQRCVTYANARFDFAVGWRTSSIRRQNELPKLQRISKNDRYPHVVNVEPPSIARFEQEVLTEDNRKKLKTSDMEELMIRGLTRVSWERVDVSFQRSTQRFLAHSTIQVKSYSINSDGADVILHMIDNFVL
ncbi:alpha/beta-Hydrolases superfamily protein [Thalictrum thalictroides]|uniref:Alpha/beta-Hydrolases superfamily protein n=1 Tax=Thalictrum thalictroides TaxID=46969 RepID=A0A7J6WH97_THATH|nr:alpha/beta-Hydrolases superfamily protein [Thalictrum thalictroides]